MDFAFIVVGTLYVAVTALFFVALVETNRR